MTSPARKPGRTPELAGEYGRRITAGLLKPDDSLPIEAELAAEWRVSRTVVREAMRLLAAKGLLKVGPKVGTRVLPAEHWNMLDADVMAWHLMASEPREFVEALYEMRLINEPAAARRAARNITHVDRQRLVSALDAMGRFERGTDELIAADLAFHRIVLEASGNPILRSLGAMIEKSLSISFSLSWRQNPQAETLRQHRRVCDAICAGDGEAAELFMRRLIESAFEDVMTALYAQGGPPSPARRGDDARTQAKNEAA
ncbi:FadR/GntR family transcriptional regulator [Fulvimarina sp. 2208YS6-2-32]|uniref:FadR/GntR family transcriptional regulator n=1 Tax=Fulvimarina uroteuthidis TaxID=3098149 RepID=A0ABU5I5P6_9HYPH|nr:FadR/GntR family transcriptional regulator [Fulvimarina sp. 2208YS6-2-32]MDY8110238.1 FadR/GntR family transcriptional regulator [Fulvimarina sp. 2208YS6-2-32]